MSRKLLYKHYKGTIYEYLGEAMHTETQETYVVYKEVTENPKRYVRPAKLFFDTIEVDGAEVKRFTSLHNPESDGPYDKQFEPYAYAEKLHIEKVKEKLEAQGFKSLQRLKLKDLPSSFMFLNDQGITYCKVSATEVRRGGGEAFEVFDLEQRVWIETL